MSEIRSVTLHPGPIKHMHVNCLWARSIYGSGTRTGFQNRTMHEHAQIQRNGSNR